MLVIKKNSINTYRKEFKIMNKKVRFQCIHNKMEKDLCNMLKKANQILSNNN